MKIQKSFDLLNSEGPIIRIEKIDEIWHYNFNQSKFRHITTIKEILKSILENKAIVDGKSGKIYFLSDYSEHMKCDYEEVVEYLLEEELIKCKKDTEYFKKIYLS